MSKFSESAMLVSLTIRSYGARREDKKISREVAQQHNTSEDAGRYNKVLVAKTFLDPVTSAASALRNFHYENTLPWMDDGVRILPSANYEAYKAQMGLLRDEYDARVRAFVAAWPEIVEDAKNRLNGMFNPADYPADVAGKFDCRVRFLPVPDTSDFRVDIADVERETLRAEIADTLSAVQADAMGELWNRLGDAVKHMADRLALYKPVAGKRPENPFRDSLVQNLRDLCKLIPRLNFANDARLESIRQDIERELTCHSAQELRDDYKVREGVAARAAEIARNVSEFMV